MQSYTPRTNQGNDDNEYSLLLFHRPKVLTPGTEIYLANDVSREVAFLERGEVEVKSFGDDSSWDIMTATLIALLRLMHCVLDGSQGL